MNEFGRVLRFVALVGASALLSVGCGGDSEEQETADWLQQNGYELTVHDYLLAAEAGDLEALQLFRERGISVDEHDAETGDTALIRAAGTGQKEALRHLLSEGTDVTVTNRAGRSALHLAAQEGYSEAVRLLLSHGADPKVKDKEGWNALTAAAYHGREGVVEVLAGKMSDQLDEALLVASLQGNAAVVDQLLNRGAYVNTRSHADQTPLMLAAKAGHLEVASLLMGNGANPYALDRNDATAASLAKRSGHSNVAEFLLLPPGANGATAATAAQELSEVADAENSLDGAILELPPAEGDLPLSGDLVLNAEEGDTGLDGTEGGEAATATATESTDELAAAIVAEAAGDGESATPTAESADQGAERATAEIATVEPADGEAADVKVAMNAGDAAPPSSAAAPQKDAKRPLDGMKLESYREKPLPVMLADVVGGEAEVRVLAGPAAREAASSEQNVEPVRVREGEMIVGTPYRVASVRTNFVSSKEGKGELVDVSRMTVENTDTGEKHLLVKGVPGRSADTYAVVTMQPGEQRYVVHERDRFTAVNSRDQEEQFQVLEIRPTQVLIENLDTRQVVTVEHDGVAMR